MRSAIHRLANRVSEQVDGAVVAAAAFNPNVLLGMPGAGLAAFVPLLNWQRKAKAVRSGAAVTDQMTLVVVTPTAVYLYDFGLLKYLRLTAPLRSWQRSQMVVKAVDLAHPYDPSGRADPRTWPALRFDDLQGNLLAELQPESWEVDAQQVYRELLAAPGDQ